MYELKLTYDTSRPAHRRDAYKVSILQTDAETSRPLRQIGPVYNGIVHYRGTYATQAAAYKAWQDYYRQ